MLHMIVVLLKNASDYAQTEENQTLGTRAVWYASQHSMSIGRAQLSSAYAVQLLKAVLSPSLVLHVSELALASFDGSRSSDSLNGPRIPVLSKMAMVVDAHLWQCDKLSPMQVVLFLEVLP